MPSPGTIISSRSCTTFSDETKTSWSSKCLITLSNPIMLFKFYLR
jgi:hypothetical protein